jgi:hypothetical protein
MAAAVCQKLKFSGALHALHAAVWMQQQQPLPLAVAEFWSLLCSEMCTMMCQLAAE